MKKDMIGRERHESIGETDVGKEMLMKNDLRGHPMMALIRNGGMGQGPIALAGTAMAMGSGMNAPNGLSIGTIANRGPATLAPQSNPTRTAVAPARMVSSGVTTNISSPIHQPAIQTGSYWCPILPRGSNHERKENSYDEQHSIIRQQQIQQQQQSIPTTPYKRAKFNSPPLPTVYPVIPMIPLRPLQYGLVTPPMSTNASVNSSPLEQSSQKDRKSNNNNSTALNTNDIINSNTNRSNNTLFPINNTSNISTGRSSRPLSPSALFRKHQRQEDRKFEKALKKMLNNNAHSNNNNSYSYPTTTNSTPSTTPTPTNYDPNPFKCENCGKSYKHSSCYEKHVKWEHSLDWDIMKQMFGFGNKHQQVQMMEVASLLLSLRNG